MKKFIVLFLVGLLFCATVGCNKTENMLNHVGLSQTQLPEETQLMEFGQDRQGQAAAALPAIYVDGVAYQITKDDGIQNLQTIHNGLVLEQDERKYDQMLNIYMTTYRYFLHPLTEDATKEIEEPKYAIWIKARNNFTGGTNKENWYILISMEGMPYLSDESVSVMADRGELQRLGFTPMYNSLSGEACMGVFTEDGPVDLYSEELTQKMLARLRTHSDYKTKSDEELIEKLKLELEFTENRVLQAENILISEGVTFLCEMKVSEHQTRIKLHAEREQIERWIDQWFPGCTFLNGEYFMGRYEN